MNIKDIHKQAASNKYRGSLLVEFPFMSDTQTVSVTSWGGQRDELNRLVVLNPCFADQQQAINSYFSNGEYLKHQAEADAIYQAKLEEERKWYNKFRRFLKGELL